MNISSKFIEPLFWQRIFETFPGFLNTDYEKTAICIIVHIFCAQIFLFLLCKFLEVE